MPKKSKFVFRSDDGREMRLYVEGGAADGLKPLEFIDKFPQFKKYDTTSVRQALNRARAGFKKKIKDRSNDDCEFITVIRFLLHYIYEFYLLINKTIYLPLFNLTPHSYWFESYHKYWTRNEIYD